MQNQHKNQRTHQSYKTENLIECKIQQIGNDLSWLNEVLERKSINQSVYSKDCKMDFSINVIESNRTKDHHQKI